MLRTANYLLGAKKYLLQKWRFGLDPYIFLVLFLAIAAAPSNFDSQSDQIAKDIERQKKSFLFPKVLVIDFPLQATGINSLSSFLADDLSAALEARLPAGTIIPVVGAG